MTNAVATDTHKKQKEPKKDRRKYIRLGIVPIEDVLPYVVFDWRDKEHSKKEYCGTKVKMVSDRLRCFARSGIKCIHCGIEGKYFAVEKHFSQKNGYHLNLYAVEDGEEILMTKDHIIPYANGGKNNLDNYQTMCTDCNIAKGSNPDV